MPKYKDLIGKRFGRFLVIKRNGYNKHGIILWQCKCDCGNLKNITSSNLLGGKTKSCGCFNSEVSRERAEGLYGSENNKKFIEADSKEKTRLSALQRKKQKRNTSGHKGVSWHKSAGKWMSQIGFKGEVIYLGLYDDLEGAIQARKEAEDKYFKPMLKKYDYKNEDAND